MVEVNPITGEPFTEEELSPWVYGLTVHEAQLRRAVIYETAHALAHGKKKPYRQGRRLIMSWDLSLVFALARSLLDELIDETTIVPSHDVVGSPLLPEYIAALRSENLDGLTEVTVKRSKTPWEQPVHACASLMEGAQFNAPKNR